MLIFTKLFWIRKFWSSFGDYLLRNLSKGAISEINLRKNSWESKFVLDLPIFSWTVLISEKTTEINLKISFWVAFVQKCYASPKLRSIFDFLTSSRTSLGCRLRRYIFYFTSNNGRYMTQAVSKTHTHTLSARGYKRPVRLSTGRASHTHATCLPHEFS